MKRFGNPSSSPSTPETGSVKERAAAWSDALYQHGDDPELRRAFERWRAADPAHAEVFDRVDRSYGLARAAGDSSTLMAMHSRTLARVAARNRHGRRRRGAIAAAVTGVAASVAIAGFVFTGGSWQDLQYLQERARYAMAGKTLYRTAAGERLAVTLEDGTALTLNTASRAVIDYRQDRRNIALAGQALFDVAHDSDRPFVVDAGNHRVTALGTAFDVRARENDFAVTLIEGKVEVEKAGPGEDTETPSPLAGEGRGEGDSSILRPGQQYIASAGLLAAIPEPVIRQADIQRAISWRNGQLIFQNDPLAEAVEEINRYGGRRIVLADDSLGHLRISGAFNTGNTAGFVATLNSYFGMKVLAANQQQIILGRLN